MKTWPAAATAEGATGTSPPGSRLGWLIRPVCISCAKIVPPSGEARWKALRLQALADGILDAGVLRLMETRRPANEQSKAWIERQRTVVNRSLDWLERHAGELDHSVTIGNITAAIVGDYLDFRFGGDDWRKGRPKLAAWQKRFAARPSMRETYPKDPS